MFTDEADPMLDALLGRALLLTGQSRAGQERILAALAAADRPVPTTDGRMRLATIAELGRQLRPPATHTERHPLIDTVTDAMNTLLIDVYANDEPEHRQLYLALRTLNLPCTPGNRGPLARVNAGMAFFLHNQGQSRLAARYDTRTAALLPEITSPRIHGELNIIRLYRAMHVSDWDRCAQFAEQAREQFSRIGLERGLEEVKMGLGMAQYFQGHLRTALASARILQRSALRRRDPMHTFYGTFAVFNYQNLLGIGEPPPVPADIEHGPPHAHAAWQTLEACRLRQSGHVEEAVALARETAAVFLARSETLAMLKECQTLLADCLLWSLEDHPERADRAGLLSTVRGLITCRTSTLSGMPVFTASVRRHQALLAHLTGRKRKVAPLLREALKRAEQDGLRVEAAHAHFAIARTQAAEPAQCNRHLSEAIALYEEIGMKPALTRLRQWQSA